MDFLISVFFLYRTHVANKKRMNICMLFRIQVERKNKKLRWDRYATRITFYSLQRWDGNVTAECKSTHYTLIHSYTPYTMNMYNSYHLLLSSIYTWNSNNKGRRWRGRKKFVHMRIVSDLFVMTFKINVEKHYTCWDMIRNLEFSTYFTYDFSTLTVWFVRYVPDEYHIVRGLHHLLCV